MFQRQSGSLKNDSPALVEPSLHSVKMTVEEALASVSIMPATQSLVARSPLTWGAEALFVSLTDDYRVPAEVLDAGYKYLLDAEDINHILEYAKTKKLSSRSVAELVIHYSVNDAFPAWIDDVPDA